MQSRDSDLQGPEIVEMGIDLSEFYKSVEWDILGVPAARFFITPLNVYLLIPFFAHVLY